MFSGIEKCIHWWVSTTPKLDSSNTAIGVQAREELRLMVKLVEAVRSGSGWNGFEKTSMGVALTALDALASTAALPMEDK